MSLCYCFEMFDGKRWLKSIALATLVSCVAGVTVFGQAPKDTSTPIESPHENSLQPSALPSESTGVGSPLSNDNKQASDPKDFSELTLFLFGSGLALFIALLGWSDQIRGIDKDTRELEDRFLNKTQIDKKHFIEIVKSGDPNQQIVALTQAINDGKITNPVSAEVLQMFDGYIAKLRPLEKLSDCKYVLTIVLTIVLFVCGIVSLFAHPQSQTELLALLLLPITLIVGLLGIIVWIAVKEKVLRSILNEMSDLV